jgi:hypothetical protein
MDYLRNKQHGNVFNSTFHEKKVRTLSYPALKEQTYDAKTIHVLYQNHLGQLVSISKG